MHASPFRTEQQTESNFVIPCYATNKRAQAFLNEQWICSGVAPVELAKQMYRMLTSSKIGLNPPTYRLLFDIAIDAEDLEMATEMSIQMEKQTGARPYRGMLNKMVTLHVASKQKNKYMGEPVASKQTNKCLADTDELVAALTRHTWYGAVGGQQQTHLIYVGPHDKLYCLSMTTTGPPWFAVYDLTWDKDTLYWGRSGKWIVLGSTCADISSGKLVWEQWGSQHLECEWKWFACETHMKRDY
jgi:hypothetical protein